MKLIAPGALVLVEPVYESFIEGSKIVLLHERDKEYIGEFHGIVLSIGPESKHRFWLKIGEKIRFRRHEGRRIEHDDKKYLALKDRWIDGRLI